MRVSRPIPYRSPSARRNHYCTCTHTLLQTTLPDSTPSCRPLYWPDYPHARPLVLATGRPINGTPLPSPKTPPPSSTRQSQLVKRPPQPTGPQPTANTTPAVPCTSHQLSLPPSSSFGIQEIPLSKLLRSLHPSVPSCWLYSQLSSPVQCRPICPILPCASCLNKCSSTPATYLLQQIWKQNKRLSNLPSRITHFSQPSQDDFVFCFSCRGCLLWTTVGR